MSQRIFPKAFLERRGHSLLGLWLVIYIIFHLLTNSQAALLWGEDGQGFIHDVNWIHNLPYLIVIECLGLGIPIILHGWWGVRYALQGRINSIKSDGSTPSLEEYSRNRAYTWQRITSWILLIGITAHVVHMRIVEYPSQVKVGSQEYYVNNLSYDAGLPLLADRLGVTLYRAGEPLPTDFHMPPNQDEAVLQQRTKEVERFTSLLNSNKLSPKNTIIIAKDFGAATLLMVRDTFKSPIMIALYSVLVISACFHAFNGLWTFCLSWGVIVTPRSQKKILRCCQGLMGFVAFLGLMAVWGSFWINLYS